MPDPHISPRPCPTKYRAIPLGTFLMISLFALLAASCSEDSGGAAYATSSARTGFEAESPVLRFTAIPDQNSTELKEKFDAWAKYLSSKLNVAVEYVPSVDYKASVEMFRNGDIQLAWFGGLTGVQARRSVPGARAIAQGENDPIFVSYFIVHRDTGIEKSDAFPMGLEGMSFTFGSQSSTSGRLMPEYHIRNHTGRSPEAFFNGLPGFSGSHDRTCELVETGQVQAGAVNYKVYDQRVAEGLTDPDVCRVVWTTPPYADYNFTAHPALEEMFGMGFIDDLQRTIIETTDPALLKAFPRNGLIAAENADFDSLGAIAQKLGFVR